jgi:hypothetical protein
MTLSFIVQKSNGYVAVKQLCVDYLNKAIADEFDYLIASTIQDVSKLNGVDVTVFLYGNVTVLFNFVNNLPKITQL